ncbi:hypothetical protein SUGI_0758450 [Cryptomeria japonica]|nr:hypothetical protein SUGI_0758450 [Cryptomeria japonica]
MRQETVCVTGAGGFIASWLVKRLLNKGYTVKGAVRNPDDGKYEHLRELEGAKERLQLVKADILDYQSMIEAIRGCDGVFHMACLLTDDPEQVIEPAVKGTANVLDACAEWGVKRLVMTSSVGTVYMDPNRDPHLVVDENCWSDLDHCVQTKNWYCYAKTVAEKAAWKRAEERNLDMVVVNPSLVLGPLLQPSMNASTAHIMKYLTEANMHRGELVALLAQLFPQYPLPLRCSDQKNPRKQAYKFSNEKMRKLGLSFTPMKECLADTVASLQNKGFLH